MSTEVNRRDAEAQSVETSQIYCSFRSFYWFASCRIAGTNYETKNKLHGGARQAADEICKQLVDAGHTITSLRRIYSKTYQVTISAPLRLCGEKGICGEKGAQP